VGLGAIVVVGAEREIFSSAAPQSDLKALLTQPLACVEILGRSVLESMIERFVRADVETITVLVAAEHSCGVEPLRGTYENVSVRTVDDVFSAVSDQLRDYSQRSIEHSFVVSASVYAETDLLDLFYFHREARQVATRGMDRDGTLDLWVVDCAQAHQGELEGVLAQADKIGATYFIRDYVNRLQHPQDLRRLVSDALSGRCAMRPCGREVRPGIWIDAGAEIDRGARIVAPAYVGRGSKIQEDTLITRFSSIEKDCYVDCGTVVEDSSILANTYVGIWLEVRHAVANGNRFLSLEHEVVLEISDPCVMRSTRPAPQETKDGLSWSRKAREQKIVADPNPKQSPAPEAWQLGADLIQG
jgi:NDP-sugar pyrophosphorylase family protein